MLAYFLVSVTVVMAGAVVAGAASTRHVGSRELARRRLRHMPRSTVSECRSGRVVKLVGHLEYVGKPLVAPLSRRPCACYELAIEDRDTGAVFVRTRESPAFLLRDETGCAWVEVQGAVSVLSSDCIVSLSRFGPMEIHHGDQLRHRLGEFDIRAQLAIPSYKDAIVREHILSADQQVVVCGYGIRAHRPAPGAAPDAPASPSLVVRGNKESPLYISNMMFFAR